MYPTMSMQVPGERAEQLKLYAKANGLGLTEALGALLRLAGAADSVPGFVFEPIKAPGLWYRIGFDGFTMTTSCSELMGLAAAIERFVATPGEQGWKIANLDERKSFTVARGRGTSMIIIGRDEADDATAKVRTLSIDVARDLARQIRNVLPKMGAL
jgi:hypothetical protein